MDMRKLKTLVDLVSESNISELEITEAEGKVRIVKGGDGGFGNLHFKTSTNRAPRQKTPGWPGEQKKLKLELKVLADVGLLGMPNAFELQHILDLGMRGKK